MAHIFDYSVLVAIPDPSRGERVNVGIVIIRDGVMDVRLSEMNKVKALTGHEWKSYDLDLRKHVTFELFEKVCTPKTEEVQVDRVFRLSGLGRFSVGSLDEYEASVSSVLKDLVIRPKAPKKTREKQTSWINTEIADYLRNQHLLAETKDHMDDHKVVRDYTVEDGLNADFAQQNGVLRVAATLDLRRSAVRLDQAAIKAVTLDRVRNIHDDRATRIGIVATNEPNPDDFKPHIKMMREYSDQFFNWSDADDRVKFMDYIRDGVPSVTSLF